MAKPTEPNIEFPQAFAIDGQKTDFLEEKIQNGFDPIDPDVLAGDNLNKFIDDTYKGLHYSIDAVNDLYKGAVLYSPTETYNSKSIVFNIGEDGIALYRSLTDNNLGNPLTDIEKWQAVDLGGSSSSGSGLSMFDLVVKDHILSYEESKGFGLQGTYVYKDAVPGSRYGYPDFYNRCVEEKAAGTETQTQLGDATITTYNNVNGHIFYDIKDKEAVDEWFDTYGIADFYGVDKENERIFLPRNNKFFQFTTDTTKVNDMVEAGLPNIEGTMSGDISEGSATGALKITNAYNGSMWSGNTPVLRMRNWSFDASLSNPIYGKSDTVQPPSSLKLLYYVVGNTDVQSAATDIVDVTTTENDTLPLFYNFYAKDEDMADAVSFVKSTGTFVSGNLYPTAYEKLVARVGTGNVKAHTDDYTDYDFVVNQDDMTFRLPLKNGKETMFSTACKGNGITLGLTNGATNYGVGVTTGTTTALDGYTGLYGTNIGAKNTGTINTQNLSMGVTTDFTKSGIVPHIEVPEGYGLYYKLLNAVVNQELVDFAHIQTELNTKLSRSNKEEIVSWGMPDYTAGVAITTSTTNQTIESDGYLYLVADSYALNRPDYFYINDIQFMFAYTTGVTSYTEMNSLFAPVLKGDRLRFSSPEHAKVTLYPLKGAN